MGTSVYTWNKYSVVKQPARVPKGKHEKGRLVLQRFIGGSRSVLRCQRLDTFNHEQIGGAKRNTLFLQWNVSSKLFLCSTSESQPFADHILSWPFSWSTPCPPESLGTNPTGRWRWRRLGWPGRLGLWTWEEKQGTVKTALCRGLSLRPQSFFPFGMGRKLKVIIAKSSSLLLKQPVKV